MAGHIVRVHAHATAKQKQIAAFLQMAADYLRDHFRVIRGKLQTDNL
jgi:hypothetical protein